MLLVGLSVASARMRGVEQRFKTGRGHPEATRASASSEGGSALVPITSMPARCSAPFGSGFIDGLYSLPSRRKVSASTLFYELV